MRFPAVLPPPPENRILLLKQVPGYTRSMRVSSCELWRSLAKFCELWRTHNAIFTRSSLAPEFRRRSPTFTRVLVKVPSVCGWLSECAQSAGKALHMMSNTRGVKRLCARHSTCSSVWIKESWSEWAQTWDNRKLRLCAGTSKAQCQYSGFQSQRVQKSVGWSPVFARKRSGTFRGVPRLLLNCDLFGT